MKSYGTDFACIVLTLVGYSFGVNFLLMAGLFGLSGALTNQLAIHMLFEKVPFLYGSGIIELKFEEIKVSIKNMILEQFFNKEQLNKFFDNEKNSINLSIIVEDSDFEPVYLAMQKTVTESQFGGMLAMFGGASVLDNLKESFIDNIKQSLKQIVASEEFNEKLNNIIKSSSLTNDALSSIESLIDVRLQGLSALHVKEILQSLIREYMGWIVVWGGFFGALMGGVSSFII